MENYSIYDEIGRGTHSFVYKARRKRSIEYVAVKSTAKSRMDKILNEVQLLHKLDSRHVLRFYNWYESQNHIWLIFEFCIGGDLLNLITQDKSLPEHAVRLFGSELVAGLQYLHSNGILFCDLKPASILIDEFGSLKLADFGLARRIPTKDAPASSPLAPGSPNYMAPELFHQPALHSFASDFWALGCVLYELCVGRQPFTHTNFPELARMIQHDKLELPVPGCEMNASFWDLLERLLEKDPYKRITWDELTDHPFWEGLPRLVKLQMPAQEIFDSAKRANQKAQQENSSSNSAPKATIARNHSESGRQPSDDNDAKSHQQSADHASRDSSCTTDDMADEDDSSLSEGNVDDAGGDEDEDDELEEMSSFERHRSPLRPASAPVKARASPDSKNTAQGNREEEKSSSISRANGRALLDRSNRLRRNPNGDIPATHRDTAVAKAPRTAPPASIASAAAAGSPPTRFDGIFDRDGKLGAGLKKVSRLLFIAADSTVKPIACSEEIEPTVVPPVRSGELRFATMAPKELLACPTEKLESHLKDVYLSLKSTSTSASEKCSVLGYLSTLCLHSKLANVIVNSSILSLLARMLTGLTASSASIADSSVVSMVCLDLGVLFRFATFIAPSSPEQLQDLVTTLIQATRAAGLRDRSTSDSDRVILEQTRRRALSCLGELLFYISTQKDWELPVVGLDCVVEHLGARDLLLRHYAVRTLCNMLIHGSGITLHALVCEQAALSLVNGLVELSTETDSMAALALQETTVQAIAQLVRHLRMTSSVSQMAPRVRVAVLLLVSEPTVLQALWQGIASKQSSCDLAIAAFNVLNAILETKSSHGDKEHRELAAIEASKTTLLTEVVSFSVLAKILETKSRYEDDTRQTLPSLKQNDSGEVASGHRRRYSQEERGPPNLLRAKAMLFIHLAMQTSKLFASQCIQLRHLDLVERILHPFAAHLHLRNDEREEVLMASSSSMSGLNAASSSRAARGRTSRVSSGDLYMLQCALNLVRLTIRTALKLGAECISAHEHDDTIEDRTHKHHQTVSAAPFHLFDMLLRNTTCKTQLVSYFVANERKEYTFFLRLMTKLLVSFPNESLSDSSEDATKIAVVVSEILLRLLQGTGSEVNLLLSVEIEPLFTQLLPAVALQLDGTTIDGSRFEEDLHANCIRVIYVALLHSHYDLNATSAALRLAFVKEHLFPCFRTLLNNSNSGVNENVWHFAIELLFGLVSRDHALVKEIEASGLMESVLSLLRAPRDFDFHTLPASATKLVRILVETAKRTNLDELYAHGIVDSLLAGLEFTGANMLSLPPALSDLLEVLYTLLLGRYECVRKTKTERSPLAAAPHKFDRLVHCAPLVLKLCAVSSQREARSPQPQESPAKTKFAERDVQQEDEHAVGSEERGAVAELASRCLVYLSQIFGDRLNDVIFARGGKQKVDDSIARAILSSLEQSSPDGFVALRVLLTLKNCLRCQQHQQNSGGGGGVRVSRWLLDHAKLHQKVKSMAVSVGSRGSARTPRDAEALPPASSTRDQIAKTASEILRFCLAPSASATTSSRS